MTIRLHHVYVCTAVGAPGARDLFAAGLIEGTPAAHPGQGTANRRFFFESGFLELLWVHDEREAQSPLVAPTKLWDRWAARERGANPFGLCFSSEDGADSAFPFPTWEYRPDYLSGNRCLRFADELPLSEPEVFVLSWPQGQSSPRTERTDHPLGLREMRSVSIGVPAPDSVSASLRAIRDAGLVSIHRSASPELIVGFIARAEVSQSIPALALSLIGSPS